MMRIAVLGGGAMGSLFGSYLSQKNDVVIIDRDQNLVTHIVQEGILITEREDTVLYHPGASISSPDFPGMDLVLVFVKSLYSKEALGENTNLIGKDTYVLSLQNGAGHEKVLGEFAKADHVIIGTTQHNSSIVAPGHINHGGSGKTEMGLLAGDNTCIQPIVDTFNACGLVTGVSSRIMHTIWKKLFTNVSASAVTAVLQSSLDFLAQNVHAWALVENLAKEAVAVANAAGQDFDETVVVKDVHDVCARAHNAYTSIYADIHAGRKTEVDTISGYVVSEAIRLGVPAPRHAMIVEIIHAMETSGIYPREGKR